MTVPHVTLTMPGSHEKRAVKSIKIWMDTGLQYFLSNGTAYVYNDAWYVSDALTREENIFYTRYVGRVTIEPLDIVNNATAAAAATKEKKKKK